MFVETWVRVTSKKGNAVFGSDNVTDGVVAQIRSVLQHPQDTPPMFEIDLGPSSRRSIFQQLVSSVLQEDKRVTAFYGFAGVIIPIAILLLQS
mgnify:CR=1 FL=1